MNKNVKQKFESYPKPVRKRLERLRDLILEVAADTKGVGKLEETLKWGEPAYLTSESKSGTTVRIDWKPKNPDQYAMYLNCKTSLIDSYRSLFPELHYEGDRAIVFNVKDEIPEEELKLCIRMALEYHLEKQ